MGHGEDGMISNPKFRVRTERSGAENLERGRDRLLLLAQFIFIDPRSRKAGWKLETPSSLCLANQEPWQTWLVTWIAMEENTTCTNLRTAENRGDCEELQSCDAPFEQLILSHKTDKIIMVVY